MSFMDFFKKKNSGSMARDRLKLVLVSDRADCTPEIIEKIKNEIIVVISKYMEIDTEGLDIQITDGIRVAHRAHDRSDGLFDHVKGRHAIMERHRMLGRYVKTRNGILRLAMAASAFFTAGLITGMVTMAINCESLITSLFG